MNEIKLMQLITCIYLIVVDSIFLVIAYLLLDYPPRDILGMTCYIVTFVFLISLIITNYIIIIGMIKELGEW